MAIDDMPEFNKCLRSGLEIAVRPSYHRQLNEVGNVMQRTPENWQRETAVQKLQEELSRALVVVRR